MSSRWSACLAVSLWTVSMILLACVLTLQYANNGFVTGPEYIGYAVAVVGITMVGALLSIHRPGNPIGWIDLVAGFSLGVVALASEYAEYITNTNPGGLPEVTLLFWAGAWAWVPGYFVAPSIGIVLFPTGRLPSPRWRGFAWLTGGLLALMAVAAMFNTGPLLEPPDAYPQITNPLGIEPLSSVLKPIVNYSDLLTLVILVGPVVSIFARLRVATTIERQQIKWFAYAATIPIAGVVVYLVLLALPAVQNDTASVIGEFVTLVGIAVLPITIGIAILRHNLYDIDRLINRTLVYGGLTIVLLTTYFAIVLGLGGLLRASTGESSPIVVATSTLAVAALFRPMRARIQSVVDRRFYRNKYDAVRALDGFSERLRDETDLESLSLELCSVVQQTMRPHHMSLWLRAGTTIEEEL